jgi:hypothetical protein
MWFRKKNDGKEKCIPLTQRYIVSLNNEMEGKMMLIVENIDDGKT